MFRGEPFRLESVQNVKDDIVKAIGRLIVPTLKRIRKIVFYGLDKRSIYFGGINALCLFFRYMFWACVFVGAIQKFWKSLSYVQFSFRFVRWSGQRTVIVRFWASSRGYGRFSHHMSRSTEGSIWTGVISVTQNWFQVTMDIGARFNVEALEH